MRQRFPFLRLYHCHDVQPSNSCQFEKLSVPTVELLNGAQGIPVSFDALGEYFEPLPNAHFEWDGSMVWRSESEETRWRVDLQIYDLGTEIQYIEWKGTLPIDDWRDFVDVLNRSKTSSDPIRLIAHWIDAEIWLDEAGVEQLMQQLQGSEGSTC